MPYFFSKHSHSFRLKPVIISSAVLIFLGFSPSHSLSHWSVTQVCYNPLTSITFINDSIGWAVGYSSTVLGTLDGGGTWNVIAPQSTDNNYRGVHFINRDTGYIIGDLLRLRFTTDGGKSWNQAALQDFSFFPTSFQFTSENVVYAVGFGGLIAKSADGGHSWSDLQSGVAEDFYNVFFVNALVGFVIGKNNTIRKTTNGGETWNAQSCEEVGAMDMNGIYMVDSLFGCIVGTNQGILMTSDGGKTWAGSYTNPGLTLNAVSFINRNIGYVAGDGGLIFSTSDGGSSWEKENSGTFEKLHGLFSDSHGHVFAVGNNGVIVKRDTITTKSKDLANAHRNCALTIKTPQGVHININTFNNKPYVMGNDRVTTYDLRGRIIKQNNLGTVMPVVKKYSSP